MEFDKRRAILLLIFLLVPFLAFRVTLHVSPHTNLTIGAYNIHHLFIGLLLIVLGGLPLVVLRGGGAVLDVATAIFAAGMSLALDEWVYLITTDGSDASYLLPISLWGGITLISTACIYVLALFLVARSRRETARGAK